MVYKTRPVLALGLGLHSSYDDASFLALIVNRVLDGANKLAFLLNGLLRTSFHHLCEYVTDYGNDEIQKYHRVNQHKNDPDYPGHIKRWRSHSFVSARLKVSEGSAKHVEEILHRNEVEIKIVIGRVVLRYWQSQCK